MKLAGYYHYCSWQVLYFLFKIISLVFLFIVPLIALLVPYGQMMFVVLFVVLGVYLILINALMEVKL